MQLNTCRVINVVLNKSTNDNCKKGFSDTCMLSHHNLLTTGNLYCGMRGIVRGIPSTAQHATNKICTICYLHKVLEI